MLKLDQPTQDGETEIVLVTNLPAAVTALACCGAYAGRWRIEGHYQTLTDLLQCEVPTLGYPRAALFAFSMSAVAGNALAVLKGNLRVAHGAEVAAEVSDFALVDEVAEVYPGMMVAVPPSRWPRLAWHSAATVAGLLNALAERSRCIGCSGAGAARRRLRPGGVPGSGSITSPTRNSWTGRGGLALRQAGAETSRPQGFEPNNLSCSQGWRCPPYKTSAEARDRLCEVSLA